MIRGMHAMFYSSEAQALRAFFKEKLGLASTDMGDGWLIFDAPEADLGVTRPKAVAHPREPRRSRSTAMRSTRPSQS
jgi:hypothetical protein